MSQEESKMADKEESKMVEKEESKDVRPPKPEETTEEVSHTPR